MSLGGAVEGKYTDYSGEVSGNKMESFRNRVWYAAFLSSLYSPFQNLFRFKRTNQLLKFSETNSEIARPARVGS